MELFFFATNGPSYPGSGPNRIIEYRNLDWMTTDVDYSEIALDQFVKISSNSVAKDSRLNLEFSKNFIGSTYELISFSGQIVQGGKINAQKMEVGSNQFAVGTYYIKASNEEGTITKKIIIQ